MAVVTFQNITKRFGEGRPAVDDLELQIKDKEFLVLVGPSGCGKSTTLRMLAGLETPSEGNIYIDERDVTEVAPKDRDIAMVFQSYALYPHMTVRDNLAFGLKNRDLKSREKSLAGGARTAAYVLIILAIWLVSLLLDQVFFGGQPIFLVSVLFAFGLGLIVYPELREFLSYNAIKFGSRYSKDIENYLNMVYEIDKKVEQTATILQIEELLDRKPKQLSGGQRQRVAVGRAIIRSPKVFLMDEPLSNLDAKLRNSTRAELASLQSRLETTTLYVTHDQVEAMTLGHRIAVMNHGIIEQVGTPEEVYGTPQTSFVAGFIGTPPMNLVDGVLKKDGGFHLVTANGTKFEIPDGFPQKGIVENWVDKEITLGFRPETVKVGEKGQFSTPGEISFTEAVGSQTNLFVHVDGVNLNIVEQGYKYYQLGTMITFELNPDDVHIFDKTTTYRIENVK